MVALLRKLIYAGIGAVAVTEDKAREIVAELEKKGHVTAEEGKKLLKELVEKGEKRSEELKKTISQEVKKATSSLKLVKAEDFNKLENCVEELSKKVDELLQRCKQ